MTAAFRMPAILVVRSPVGTKEAAHLAPGGRHRAFGVDPSSKHHVMLLRNLGHYKRLGMWIWTDD